MKLEDQVVSLGLAKKLKRLGVKQEEAYFCWGEDAHGEEAIYRQSTTNPGLAAFTVAELGEMLPDWFYTNRLDGGRGWACVDEEHINTDDPDCPPEVNEKTEADARAKMLIYLIEKGVVKP